MAKNITEEIILDARELCQKFVTKVRTGQARSRETYQECEDLLQKIDRRALNNVDKSGS